MFTTESALTISAPGVSSRRQFISAVAGGLAGAVAIGTLASGPKAVAAGGFDSSRIADFGLAELGTTRALGWNQPGECIVSMARWLSAAGGTWAGGGVISSYQRSGGDSIALGSVVMGDVLQRTNGDDQNWDRVHTVVVVQNYGNGTYWVVQSNANFDGKVTENRAWTPTSPAGWYWMGWRMGSPKRTSPSTPTGPAIDQFAGQIVQWTDERPTPVTSWLVGPDLTRTWIPDGGTFNWMKAAGAPGPARLVASQLDALRDRTGVRAATDQLGVNWSAPQSTSMWSNGGGYLAVLQGDGNFVVYAPGSRAVWCTRTGGANRIVMQGDGNMVIYNSANRATWASNTSGNGKSRLVMQSDGNLVIYRADGRATWATYTNGGTNQLGRPAGYRL